jgi:hypothetical protein
MVRLQLKGEAARSYKRRVESWAGSVAVIWAKCKLDFKAMPTPVVTLKDRRSLFIHGIHHATMEQ